ncbi:IS30 family transposase [uncultured Dysosmobacter sp.]|uniref:IS30 family transposase n=1 Tax=uncultured Dysosmobacter sp. TaxID=2591384 RepID=UPI0026050085|nr:IS30 family transposase [uncultured Dysosmobacter sp.]
MGHFFSHLTKTDRYKIEALLNAGHSKKEIAAEIHVHISTIYREIKRARMIHRNSDWTEEERYNPDEAERRYRENLAAKGAPLKIGSDYELADYLEGKMLDKESPRSPAAALADIELEGKQFKTTICVSTLYSYITKGVFLTLTNDDLPEKPKRKRKYRTVKQAKRAPRGESIEKRPAEADGRAVFGYWEMDTVYSAAKTSKRALLVLTERKTRKEIIEPIFDRTSESTIKALDRIERRYGKMFRKIFKAITVDNGGEFSDVERLERSAIRKGKRTKFYYCHPYSSFERGSNENQNKMIRRQHPKGTDFGKVSTAAIKKTEAWINNYPRKVLGWKTADMAFAECVAAL